MRRRLRRGLPVSLEARRIEFERNFGVAAKATSLSAALPAASAAQLGYGAERLEERGYGAKLIEVQRDQSGAAAKSLANLTVTAFNYGLIGCTPSGSIACMTEKIVWILGAGFSRALGAPLLPQLLTRRSVERARFAFPDVFKPSTQRELELGVLELYAIGRDLKLWVHAEEFIEALDLIVEDADGRGQSGRNDLEFLRDQAIERAGSGPIHCRDFFRNQEITSRHVRDLALRLVAAECCEFLQGANPRFERWEPYRDWMDSLREDDTVITFNYDRIPDILSMHDVNGNPVGEPRAWIAPPTEAERWNGAAETRSARGPLVLKMHGSVDWIVDRNEDSHRDIIRRAEPRDVVQPECAAVHCNDAQLALATPGPKKQRMTAQQGPLHSIWKLAAMELHAANAIVFLGYRIPPTDAQTLGWLAGRIRGNARVDARGMHRARAEAARNEGQPQLVIEPEPDKLVVHTVLGPNVGHEDSRRLSGIIGALVSSRDLDVNACPMGAEDFIGLMTRDWLVGRGQVSWR